MPQYVNVGCYIDHVRPKSKKAIKDALKEIAEGKRAVNSVCFDATDAFSNAGKRFYPYIQESDRYPDGMKPGVSYQVVVPDPYTDRRSYGTVRVNKEGVIVCS